MFIQVFLFVMALEFYVLGSCPAGSYCNDAGVATPCPVNTYSVVNASACFAPPPGKD